MIVIRISCRFMEFFEVNASPFLWKKEKPYRAEGVSSDSIAGCGEYSENKESISRFRRVS